MVLLILMLLVACLFAVVRVQVWREDRGRPALWWTTLIERYWLGVALGALAIAASLESGDPAALVLCIMVTCFWVGGRVARWREERSLPGLWWLPLAVWISMYLGWLGLGLALS